VETSSFEASPAKKVLLIHCVHFLLIIKNRNSRLPLCQAQKKTENAKLHDAEAKGSVLVFCCFCGSLNRSFQTLKLSLQPFQPSVSAALGVTGRLKTGHSEVLDSCHVS
jgi:hypothetical protein